MQDPTVHKLETTNLKTSSKTMANQNQYGNPSHNQNTQILPPPRSLSYTHHPQPHKFYLERYPSYLSYHDLRAHLLQIGTVQSLFLQENQTKLENDLGFVPFPLKTQLMIYFVA